MNEIPRFLVDLQPLMKQRYNDFGSWIRQQFPFRVQKIAVNAGFSCPNRDGRIGTTGCIYCNNLTFNPSYCDSRLSITDQLEVGKRFFARKYPDMKYLAYFQAYTNTYASLSHLKAMYEEALSVSDVVGLVIGTRPDCISDELLDYLQSLQSTPLPFSVNNKASSTNQQVFKPFILIEYGIESCNDETLKRINRGHNFQCVQKAVEKTAKRGITVGGHIIMGLPGEDFYESIRQASIISSLPLNILKMHQLQVIKHTPLAKMFIEEPFYVFTVDEYIRLIGDYIQHLRPSLVLERFVSQSPAQLLIAPKWGLKNHEFTHKLNKYLEANDIFQGKAIIGKDNK